MYTWNEMRHKLEKEYLADSLRGRIQYFVTRYRKSHDQEGRAAILLDGKEVLQGNFYNYYLKSGYLPPEDPRHNGWDFCTVDGSALDLGMFDQLSFFRAFSEFDNQSIEKSMSSDNLLVRIFSILDRRVGKRRLLAMKEQMRREPQYLQFFFCVRAEAEGLDIEL